MALGNLIENWHFSDFHISSARSEQEAGYAEHLSAGRKPGPGHRIFIQHPDVFKKVLKKLSMRVPGIQNIEAKTTEEGRVLPKFHDDAFEDPFPARFDLFSGISGKMCAFYLCGTMSPGFV